MRVSIVGSLTKFQGSTRRRLHASRTIERENRALGLRSDVYKHLSAQYGHHRCGECECHIRHCRLGTGM